MALTADSTIVMTGALHAAREEKCTHYWAIAGALNGVGVLTVVFNGGASNYFFLVLGNATLVAGMVMPWIGLQSFYGRQPNGAGSIILWLFLVIFLLVLFFDAPAGYRSIVFSVAAGAIYSACFTTLWRERDKNISFWKNTGSGRFSLAGCGYADSGRSKSAVASSAF